MRPSMTAPAGCAVLLAGLACAVVVASRVLHARRFPVSTSTLALGTRHELLESAAAMAAALALAVALTGAMLVRGTPAKGILWLAAALLTLFSPWAIQAVADTASWAHPSAYKLIPLLSWITVPLVLLVTRYRRLPG